MHHPVVYPHLTGPTDRLSQEGGEGATWPPCQQLEGYLHAPAGHDLPKVRDLSIQQA
jgi:hypothetical protein